MGCTKSKNYFKTFRT